MTPSLRPALRRALPVVLPLLAPLGMAAAPAPQIQAGVTGAQGGAGRVAEPVPQVIDFSGLQRGTILSEVYANHGAGPIGVHATNPNLGAVNAAVVFDSGMPTGGDFDLGTPNEDFGGPGVGEGGELGSPYQNDRALGQILIVARNLTDANHDGLVDDPNDMEQKPGPIVFDFSAIGPVSVHFLTVIDIEHEDTLAEVELYDEFGGRVGTALLPITDDNGVGIVDLGGASGVYEVHVLLAGSGAIDELVFSRDCASRLGDLVWNDLDRDGIQDAGEPGLEGVVVRLRDQFGRNVGTTLTDRDGAYAFEDLCEGIYHVDIDAATVQRDFVPSDCDVGEDETVDNDCSPVRVRLPDHRTVDDTVDFGFNAPCSGRIGDFLWHDMNENGLQDADEPGLEEVRVDLYDSMGMLVASTTTGPQGSFSFGGLCQGSYTLEVDDSTLPRDFIQGLCDVGGDDTIDGDCSPVTVVLPTDFIEQPDVDFGYVSPFDGSIGDFVWLDTDCDGFLDEDGGGFLAAQEGGLGGVRLILRDDMGVVVQRTSSNTPVFAGGTLVAGVYRFTGLRDGLYVIEIDPNSIPAGLVASPCNPGLNDDLDNDCTQIEVVLDETNGGNVTIIFDFAYHPDPCEGEGCSHTFWRDPANFGDWPAPLTPTTEFSDVFEPAFVPRLTLLQILNQSGGGLNALGRQVVAAVLNAQSPDVDFALPVEDVIQLFNDVHPGPNSEYEALANYLQGLNDLICPLN